MLRSKFLLENSKFGQRHKDLLQVLVSCLRPWASFLTGVTNPPLRTVESQGLPGAGWVPSVGTSAEGLPGTWGITYRAQGQ